MMNPEGKNILIIGLARSGAAAADYLLDQGASVIIYDQKGRTKLDGLEQLEGREGVTLCLGGISRDLIKTVDFAVVSPGVPLDIPPVLQLQAMGIEVISEIELAWRRCDAPIVAITGTNGKTTTTALTGAILKASGIKTHIVGNIGVPFISRVEDIKTDDIVVAEISSFQLETIRSFKPVVAAVLNISEDHLNRHKTMDRYIHTKTRIYENLSPGDFIVLNGDDEVLKSIDTPHEQANVFYFSRSRVLNRGAWIQGDNIVADIGYGIKKICPVKSVKIPGVHNLENCLAASLMSCLMGVDPEVIGSTLSVFPGVEHRVEMVEEINRVAFYNDSKGTNPNASIKAIESMNGPTVLIAGGMDKKNDFTEFIEAFGDTVVHLVVLGETADKIASTARDKGFSNIHRVKTLDQAVRVSYKLASPGFNVLLSPACASWDMFKDYEERGRIFKSSVRELRRQVNDKETH